MESQHVLIIIRGLPGSGKSTFGQSITLSGEVPPCHSADFFMTDPNGVYHFDPSKLKMAHEFCQEAVRSALFYGESVAVANTFTQRWEMEPYLLMAAEHEARVIVVDCFDAGMTDAELAAKNIHGVSEQGIAAMRARWEHDWRSGDPRAPWARG